MKSSFETYNYNTQTQKMKYPFRKGNVKPASPKRITKVSSRELKSFNVLLCYFTIPFRIKNIPVVFTLLITIIKDFFLLQFFQKMHLFHLPLTYVDHPLDDKVPFEPERVNTYMDFINLWIRPLSMLIKRYGAWNAMPLCREFIRYLTQAYKQASRMYKCNLTTTHRPNYTKTKQFKMIHRLDPHFLCVPSLHIAIVCLCFSFYKMLFEREHFTEQEKTKWNKELYDSAIAIAETVLYIKQHSLNCIAAALYMTTKIEPELFSTTDAYDFINNLFTNAPTIKSQDRKEIIAHIQFTYERFLLEGAAEDDWFNPVLRWVKSYNYTEEKKKYRT